MSAILAEPYQGYMINYTQHAGGKDTSHDDIISYGAAQLLQDRPELRYHSDTTLPPFGPPSTFITDRMIPRHVVQDYNAHGYEMSPPQGSRKRQHTDDQSVTDRNLNGTYLSRPRLHSLPTNQPAHIGDSADMGYPVHVEHGSHQSNHDYLPPVALPLPQQHHHHHLPSQASTVSMSQAGSSVAMSEEEESENFVKQPGFPERLPKPKGPKLKFSIEEDNTLIELKEKHGLTWKQIGYWFPGRKSNTLQVRYCTRLKVKTVVWNAERDMRLYKAIEDYENERWRVIAQKVGHGVTPAACKDRAANQPPLQLGILPDGHPGLNQQ